MTALSTHYHNAHVLVVDDDPVCREIVESLLAEVGITAHVAGHGQHALDILSEAGPSAFDLVLIDIQMPFMDGIAVTREIRTQPEFSLLPVVAMTAQIMAHETNPGAETGLNDQIGKPFDVAAFYRMLTQWIPASKHPPGKPAESMPTPRRTLPARDGIDVRAAGYPDIAAGKGRTFKGRVGLPRSTELPDAVITPDLALRNGVAVDELLAALKQSIQKAKANVARVRDKPCTQ